MAKVVGFGEIMLRLSPPGQLRFAQAASFDALYGGAESNVLASLAQWGQPVDLITRLPEHEIGDSCLQSLRRSGIGTRYILRGGERVGIYFLEMGSSVRASKVIYDRAGSSLAGIQPGMVNWEEALAGASWFHWTGVTPAVSQGACETLQEGLQVARRLGLTISCDLNFRANLWKWGKKAGEVMPELVRFADIAVGNEEDAEKVFGIRAEKVNVRQGRVSAENYLAVCEQLNAQFPNLQKIAITLRGSISASQNTWGGLLWNGENLITSSGYQIMPIVDRVGAGDSFSAGLIFGLINWPGEDERALRFAVAASALKHTIFGDFNQVSQAEVEKLMAGDGSGRITR